MKILLITYDNFDDAEVLYPLFRMKEEGHEVTVASLEKRTVNGKKFFTVPADLLPAEIDPDAFDALILPGGTAPEKLRQNPEILRAVRKMFEDGKPVCAICHGPQILISAGCLKAMRCTCYPGIRDDVIMAGACYENRSVCVDRNLVTSRRPEDLPDFMREFCLLLRSRAGENA